MPLTTLAPRRLIALYLEGTRGVLASRGWMWLILLMAGLVLPHAHAADNSTRQPQTRFLVDPTGSLDPSAVIASPQWQALPHEGSWPLAPAGIWFRFQAHQTDSGPDVIVVPRVFLDELTVFSRTVDGNWRGATAGDQVRFSSWPSPMPVTAVPVALGGSNPSGEVLVRLRHGSSYRDVPSLWSARAWQAALLFDHIIVGLFLGVALTALAYALGEAVTRRDAVSGWYGLHVLLMMIVVSGQLGYVRLYLGIEDAAMHRGYLFGAGSLLAAVTLLFVRRALPQAFGGQTASVWSLAVALLGVALGGAYAFRPYAAENMQLWWGRFVYYAAALACLIGLLWASRGVRMPQRWWYRAAFASATIGLASYTFHAAGLVPTTMDSRILLPFSGMIEFILLTYALSLSSKLAGDTGPAARERALDRSSGFLHASELPALLVAMALRAMRVKQAGSVVLLHVSNLPDLEVELGGQAGMAAEQAAIRTLRLALRPGDEVIRIDSAHYVVLLHRVHGQAEARDFALRVQALGLQHCPELPQLLHIHWHAAIGHMPQHIQRNPEKLPQRLMQLVGQIRHGSAALVRELP